MTLVLKLFRTASTEIGLVLEHGRALFKLRSRCFKSLWLGVLPIEVAYESFHYGVVSLSLFKGLINIFLHKFFLFALPDAIIDESGAYLLERGLLIVPISPSMQARSRCF